MTLDTLEPSKEPPPSHPDLFRVERRPGSFNSCLLAQKCFAEGEVLCKLQGLTKGPKAYSSVQCGPGDEDHFELGSDLLYMNHSCEPNVAVDLLSPSEEQWCIRAIRDIEKGDSLTFFYPSTEWEMSQPFDCNCGKPTCLKSVAGAKFLSREELSRRGLINKHIWELVEQREKEKNPVL